LGLIDLGGASPLDHFFSSYGNEEYNNPGGAMAAIIDYGIPGGLVWYGCMGLMLGWLYGRFRLRDPIGLLTFPLAFTGIAILTQLIYWGDPRFIAMIGAVAVTLLLVTRPSHRSIPNGRLAKDIGAR